MNEYSSSPKYLKLKSCRQVKFSVLTKTLIAGTLLALLCSQRILQSQPTGLAYDL